MEFGIGLFVGMIAGLVAGVCLMWDQREIRFDAHRDAEMAGEHTIEQRARRLQ